VRGNRQLPVLPLVPCSHSPYRSYSLEPRSNKFENQRFENGCKLGESSINSKITEDDQRNKAENSPLSVRVYYGDRHPDVARCAGQSRVVCPSSVELVSLRGDRTCWNGRLPVLIGQSDLYGVSFQCLHFHWLGKDCGAGNNRDSIGSVVVVCRVS
jgi:hypothetical protein